ncbi:MAG: hypothetical protein AAFO89_10225 [Planctomycetota bacterium]
MPNDRCAATILSTALVCGNAAGDVQVFENTSGFGWVPFFDIFVGNALDITRPSDDQPSDFTVPSFAYDQSFATTSTEVFSQHILGFAGARIARGDMILVQGELDSRFFTRPELFTLGDSVGPDSTYGSSASIGTDSLSFTSVPRLIPDKAIIGLSIPINGAVHYGWLELDGLSIVRWAYEADPGIPAKVIPAPASAAPLGLGCLAFTRRRQ